MVLHCFIMVQVGSVGWDACTEMTTLALGFFAVPLASPYLSKRHFLFLVFESEELWSNIVKLCFSVMWPNVPLILSNPPHNNRDIILFMFITSTKALLIRKPWDVKSSVKIKIAAKKFTVSSAKHPSSGKRNSHKRCKLGCEQLLLRTRKRTSIC